MRACLQEVELVLPDDHQGHLCDESLFRFENGVGKCLTGDVREVATVTMMKHIPTFLADDSWITLLKVTTNPFMKKFFLSQVCLTHISSHGLEVLDNKLKQMPFEYYDGLPRWSRALLQEGSESANELRYLYIRPQTIGSLIDGIAVILDKRDNVLELFFFQIGPNEDEECVDETFYPLKWKQLKESLTTLAFTRAYELRSTYVFLHNGRSEGPIHMQKKVTVNRRKIEYRLCRLGYTSLNGLSTI